MWELDEAYEGFAQFHGWKKKLDPKDYPDDEGRKKLRERLERERGNA